MVNQNEEAIVRCETTAGSFSMKFYRSWSPNGYDRAIELFEKKYYDESFFFRVVPKFLVQFGISYIDDEDLQKLSNKKIPDEPSKGIKFNRGTISFAGSGPNSRTSHLFIAYGSIKSLGTQPWETALGEVIEGMDNVENLYSYGDMPPWGNGPPQGKVYIKGYIEENFPKSDKFLHCKVERLSDNFLDAKEGDVVRKEDGTTDEEQFANAQAEEKQLRHRDLRPAEVSPDQLDKEQFAVPPANESNPYESMAPIGGILVLIIMLIVFILCGRNKKVDSKSN